MLAYQSSSLEASGPMATHAAIHKNWRADPCHAWSDRLPGWVLIRGHMASAREIRL